MLKFRNAFDDALDARLVQWVTDASCRPWMVDRINWSAAMARYPGFIEWLCETTVVASGIDLFAEEDPFFSHTEH